VKTEQKKGGLMPSISDPNISDVPLAENHLV